MMRGFSRGRTRSQLDVQPSRLPLTEIEQEPPRLQSRAGAATPCCQSRITPIVLAARRRFRFLPTFAEVLRQRFPTHAGNTEGAHQPDRASRVAPRRDSCGTSVALLAARSLRRTWASRSERRRRLRRDLLPGRARTDRRHRPRSRSEARDRSHAGRGQAGGRGLPRAVRPRTPKKRTTLSKTGLLEGALRDEGALFSSVASWQQPHVVIDGRLMTGQNPASAAELARAMLPSLKPQK